MATDFVGWASSVVLVLTLSRQIWKQWKAGTCEGVSKWLFVGQFVASIGFFAYSVLQRDWVFVVTNGLMAVNAVVGFALWKILKARGERAASTEAGRREAAASFA